MQRVLAIHLDGYEHTLGARYMAAGDMPVLSRLGTASGRWLLDYGAAQRTGLAGEHVASGLSPDLAGRHAAVMFDPRTYGVWQIATNLQPFPERLAARTVVVDPSYFDLSRAPRVRGLVGWGAHDPGVALEANPSPLLEEVLKRFGPYPAQQWIYGFTWPSVERTRVMGQELAHAVDVRAEMARWLLADRMPDWDLGIVTVSEPHSAIEALFHGVDTEHPLHGHPSAAAAGEGIRAVHRAIDRLLGKLTDAFPDAQLVVFSMGGMGRNRSDAASMLLLPELLHRHAFGSAFFRQPASDRPERGPVDLPADNRSWESWVKQGLPLERPFGLPNGLTRRLPARIAESLRRASRPQPPEEPCGPIVSDLAWMPARAYQPAWRRMRTFALPSFYDGRIRVNLKGRERHGLVQLADHRATLDAVRHLLGECVDPDTGTGVVDFFETPTYGDPRELGPTESDLVIVWRHGPQCLDHPRLGRIGPVPWRRTGGHTGSRGMVWVRSSRVSAGDHGHASSFDTVPTMIDLLGCDRPSGPLSGRSLLAGTV